jgi:hypothetical protein
MPVPATKVPLMAEAEPPLLSMIMYTSPPAGT